MRLDLQADTKLKGSAKYNILYSPMDGQINSIFTYRWANKLYNPWFYIWLSYKE